MTNYWQVRDRNVHYVQKKLLEAFAYTTLITSEYNRTTHVHSSWRKCLVQRWSNFSAGGYVEHPFTVSNGPHSTKKQQFII